jgi:hypothetical protein
MSNIAGCHQQNVNFDYFVPFPTFGPSSSIHPSFGDGHSPFFPFLPFLK